MTHESWGSHRGANIRKNHYNSIRFTFQFISLNSHRISAISHPISVNAHFILLISLNPIAYRSFRSISFRTFFFSHIILHVISLLISLISIISPLISLNRALNAFLACNSIRGEYMIFVAHASSLNNRFENGRIDSSATCLYQELLTNSRNLPAFWNWRVGNIETNLTKARLSSRHHYFRSISFPSPASACVCDFLIFCVNSNQCGRVYQFFP
jgi:hypothetical protein